jgi:hypothetical protein
MSPQVTAGVRDLIQKKSNDPSLSTEELMNRQAAATPHSTPGLRDRIGSRRRVAIPGRLTWRDATGTLRFASVVTRDVSDSDAFVECQMPASIPLYRLVHFQVERTAQDRSDLPPVLRRGKLLSAIYRVGPYASATGTPQGYAIRLLAEPALAAQASESEPPHIAVAN